MIGNRNEFAIGVGSHRQDGDRAVILVKSRVSQLQIQVLANLLLQGRGPRDRVSIAADRGGRGLDVILSVSTRDRRTEHPRKLLMDRCAYVVHFHCPDEPASTGDEMRVAEG